MLSRRLKYYMLNTHLHGLNYVVDRRYHLAIRVMWEAIFVIDCIAMFLTLKSLFKNYNENSISFLTETTYLEWNTTFPAVTVCQISGMDFAVGTNVADMEYSTSLEFFLSDILFFTGSCYSCNSNCDGCSQINLANAVEKLRKSCSELIQNCTWNGVMFNCCEYFLRLETEYGICYSMNSLHTLSVAKFFNLQINKETGPSVLKLETIQDVRIYHHAPEDVPFINSESNLRKDIIVGDAYEIFFKVIEIDNDETIENIPIEYRQCRFPWELPENFKVHKYYSYSTCMVQCHAENHLRLCNCTHHLMPHYNKLGYCNIEGLRCLTDNFEIFNRVHASGYDDKTGLVCECLPSCTEPEYTIITNQKKGKTLSSGFVSISMQSLPTIRLKRTVVRNDMDLVVSVGGAAGLFIGASLLTLIEFTYLTLLNKFKLSEETV